jgi:hypothetical protein
MEIKGEWVKGIGRKLLPFGEILHIDFHTVSQCESI